MKVVLLCWRDTHHPEGGGSERYLESVAHYLAMRGHEVVYRSAHYPGAARQEFVPTQTPEAEKSGQSSASQAPVGVTFSRAGGSLSVYPRAWLSLLAARWGKGALAQWRDADVVVDTQNGVPFFASLFTTAPTVMLTHHCHREQWSVAGPILSRVGWFIESRISPWLFRTLRWVTVSTPSAKELIELGVPADNVEIVRGGVDPLPDVPAPAPSTGSTTHIVTLSRLVPHKQIEHAMDAVAALLRNHSDLRLDIIGEGWWAKKLRDYAAELGIEHCVTFHGHVSDDVKHRLLRRAVVHLMPSRKEGWGLVVIEAALHGVPTVGYRSSAGLQDSVVDRHTGLLAGSEGGFINAVEWMLDNPQRRKEMGEAARVRAQGFSWDATGRAWEKMLLEVAGKNT